MGGGRRSTLGMGLPDGEHLSARLLIRLAAVVKAIPASERGHQRKAVFADALLRDLLELPPCMRDSAAEKDGKAWLEKAAWLAGREAIANTAGRR